nr:hypothetical protein [Tanacetum cinerariifolium]
MGDVCLKLPKAAALGGVCLVKLLKAAALWGVFVSRCRGSSPARAAEAALRECLFKLPGQQLVNGGRLFKLPGQQLVLGVVWFSCEAAYGVFGLAAKQQPLGRCLFWLPGRAAVAIRKMFVLAARSGSSSNVGNVCLG